MKNLALIENLDRIDSLVVAKATGKRHGDIMRDIRLIEKNLVNAELRSLWKPGTYIDAQGKKRNSFMMTKKGLMLLISKYHDNVRLQIINRLEFLEKKSKELLMENNRMLELELSYAWNKSDNNALYKYENQES